MKFIDCLKRLHESIVYVLIQIVHAAATKPKSVLCFVPVLSITLFFVGIHTNFYMETDEVSLWTPLSSRSIQHGDWLSEESGLVGEGAQLQIIIHKNGDNVLGREGIDHAFQVVDAIRSRRGFNESSCSIKGVINFFDNDYDVFQKTVSNDNDAVVAVSTMPFLPNGDIVNRKEIFGYPSGDINGTLQSAKSYMVKIEIPMYDEGDFESDAVSTLLRFKRSWSIQNNPFTLEILSSNSYSNEFQATVEQDKKLLPFVFLGMISFSALVFYRRDRVESSSLCLGIGAVITVLLSIMTSFGLLFVIGVPFTNLTFMLPFIIFGIGLDDAYIIMGSYQRVAGSENIIDRVTLSIKDCGLSIFVTTFTTSLAFGLNLFSSIPAVKDFSVYASVCVIIDFIFQLTYFVALMVVNDERIKAERYDLIPCLKRISSNEVHDSRQAVDAASINVKIMTWYAERLVDLPKTAKIVTMLGFFTLSIYCIISSFQLEVSFDFTDMVSPDSYVKSYTHALQNYFQSEPYNCLVVFRDVNFADQRIQTEMQQYVNELVDLTFISNDQPQSFWLNDFQKFVKDRNFFSVDFDEQVKAFLSVNWYSRLYSHMIGFATDGKMISSSVILNLDIPLSDTKKQIQFLNEQEEITKAQPMNKVSSQWNFFTFSPTYFMWEFFRETTHEFMMNSVIGLGAVFFTTLVFVQHPTGCFFATLTVAMIYVDVLGIVQTFGMAINPVTHVSIILSIGLMVDYVVHVLLKYFESDSSSREDKVFDCLSTMGSSVVLGGFSTILGTIPLAFSSSEIFHAVLVIFLSFVILSLAHGLLFLPVLLLVIGPTWIEGSANLQQIDGRRFDVNMNEMSRARKDTGQSSDFSANTP